MRDINYKIKGIRMSEETWKSLKSKRKKSGLTWNMYLMSLLEEKK